MTAACPDASTSSGYVPILSLVVALLAVFVGPLLTWNLTKRQLEEARAAADRKSTLDRKLANKQIVAPMRQAWIEKLRSDTASFLALCNAYATRGTAHHNDSYGDIRKLLVLIRLSLNPAEEDHLELIESLDNLFLTVAVDTSNYSEPDWVELHHKEEWVISIAGNVFKKEWTRVKSEDAN